MFGGSGYVIEEKFICQYEDMDPIFMTGMQGLWGFLMWLVILPIMQAIKCSHPDLCPYGAVENVSLAF
jgi:hypothetical protein